MARMSDAEWVGPHHDNGVMSRYDVLCLHTIVGNPPAHAAHFSTRADGHIYQSRDTAWRSAANYNGNHRVIAVENDDFGPEYGAWNTKDGHAVPAFTAAQIEAIAAICAWANRAHGIPLVACPDSRPTSRGIAFHRQGIDGNWSSYQFSGRVSGGEVWTTSPGKVCPGDRRIAQVPQIIARARQLAGLDAAPEDDMPYSFDTHFLPPTGVDVDGKPKVEEVVFGVPPVGGGGGIKAATAVLGNAYGDTHIQVAHWRVVNTDGTSRSVPSSVADNTDLPALDVRSCGKAPAGTHGLIVDYSSELGCSVSIEAWG